jgi:hypothetical protein
VPSSIFVITTNAGTSTVPVTVALYAGVEEPALNNSTVIFSSPSAKLVTLLIRVALGD